MVALVIALFVEAAPSKEGERSMVALVIALFVEAPPILPLLGGVTPSPRGVGAGGVGTMLLDPANDRGHHFVDPLQNIPVGETEEAYSHVFYCLLPIPIAVALIIVDRSVDLHCQK